MALKILVGFGALEIAQAKGFCENLKMDLIVRTNKAVATFLVGKKTSAIARALVTNRYLYLDDSFSSLDFKTDAKLRKALKEQLHDKIKVIVAQRVSTVMDADMILVLDEGKVVGKGTHDELLANNTTYQEIVHSQLREEDLA